MKKNKKIIVWLFRAYETHLDYKNDKFFFQKVFSEHIQLKNFSANHSYKYKKRYPEYNSMYWIMKNIS